MVTAAMKLRHLFLGRKVMTDLDSILKSRHYFANKGPSSQSYGFSSSHEWKGRRQWQPTPVFLPGESQGGAVWWAVV